mmetsp:Transcript_25418/g.66355  ORF Transcript_25418/g.66355 Transcript_25418/m.66355 type:complete len:351 (-) Transcript_25418:40-1092(-)
MHAFKAAGPARGPAGSRGARSPPDHLHERGAELGDVTVAALSIQARTPPYERLLARGLCRNQQKPVGRGRPVQLLCQAVLLQQLLVIARDALLPNLGIGTAVPLAALVLREAVERLLHLATADALLAAEKLRVLAVLAERLRIEGLPLAVDHRAACAAQASRRLAHAVQRLPASRTWNESWAFPAELHAARLLPQRPRRRQPRGLLEAPELPAAGRRPWRDCRMFRNIPPQDVHVGERGGRHAIAGLDLGSKNRFDAHPPLAQFVCMRVRVIPVAQVPQQLVELRRLVPQLLLECSNLSTSCCKPRVGCHQGPPPCCRPRRSRSPAACFYAGIAAMGRLRPCHPKRSRAR